MSQINKVWNINGLEINFDLDDLETFERYEQAFEKMSIEERRIKKDGKMSETIKAYCDLYYHMFFNLFGDVADQLTEKRYHTGQWEEAYESFLLFVSDQVTHINERRNTIMKPTKNRQQRRAVQKGK